MAGDHSNTTTLLRLRNQTPVLFRGWYPGFLRRLVCFRLYHYCHVWNGNSPSKNKIYYISVNKFLWRNLDI